MADALSMSIETLILLSYECVPCETVGKVVLQIVKSKMKRLPNLKTLTFRDHRKLEPISGYRRASRGVC